MRTLLVSALCLIGLSACTLQSVKSVFDGPKPKTMKSAAGSGIKADPMRLDTIAYADAYCRGDGEAAIAATGKLLTGHPNHPRALLNHAFALDLAGKGIAAYRILENLAKKQTGMPAVLRCGDDFVYSGTVTEVAQRRLFAVKTRLLSVGVRLPLPLKHAVADDTVYRLADLAPAKSSASMMVPATQMAATRPEAPMSKPAQRKKKPAATGGKGRFVHLGSYRTTKNLEKGWRALKKRYAKVLKGQPRAVSSVNLGKKKGRYLRLGVNVTDPNRARSICRQLKAAKQYCAVRRARSS